MKDVNATMAVLIAAIIVILIGGGAVYRHEHNKNKTPTTSSTSTTSTSSKPAASSGTNNTQTTQSESGKVSIQNFAFTPSSITVKKGTKVTWTNDDSTTHTVTETDSQTGPDSGNLNPGSSYSFTFDTAGTYHYHCSIHTEMTGTVTVTE